MKVKKPIKLIIIVLLCLAVIGAASLFIINGYVKASSRDRLLTFDDAIKLEDIDCIIVLGCQVRGDGSLSDMLRDRLNEALELYNAGAAPKLLMSGDHGQTEYNEVGAMKNFAVENGVPKEDVFMDHAGFSTYETIYRAKEVFEAKKVIIVTQEYHLYRALYIAKRLGVEAYGVSSDLNVYGGQSFRDFREILARNKDFIKCIFKPKPTYLGDVIPISGSGDLTDDNLENK
ncbi:MAG: YdcF family protein [Clostridia bacterium]|nr:YdcF family protein [Clostridia bacterium]